MNETIRQLHSRKSVRVFEDREIAEDLVKEIIDLLAFEDFLLELYFD